jgi:hypothetical protein
MPKRVGSGCAVFGRIANRRTFESTLTTTRPLHHLITAVLQQRSGPR